MGQVQGGCVIIRHPGQVPRSGTRAEIQSDLILLTFTKMLQNAPTFKSGMNAAIQKKSMFPPRGGILNRIFGEAGRRSRPAGKASAIREAPPFRAGSFTTGIRSGLAHMLCVPMSLFA